jgi:molybdate transport system substrate-binding protein
VICSYGATSVLAQQIANAAPFDLFAAADAEHVDLLVRTGHIIPETRAVYARGRLALWVPGASHAPVRELRDLGASGIRYIALANPSTAPYGAAAVQALRSAGLWEALERRIVYGNSIGQAKQFAASGNADAAFTAYSLVLGEPGTVIEVDESLHAPLDQALGVAAASANRDYAMRFAAFILGCEGREILSRHGYDLP